MITNQLLRRQRLCMTCACAKKCDDQDQFEATESEKQG